MSPVKIKCPVCGAMPEKACQNEKGEKLPRFHRERIEMAREQEDEGESQQSKE